jgi:hypothetical protein
MVRPYGAVLLSWKNDALRSISQLLLLIELPISYPSPEALANEKAAGN